MTYPRLVTTQLLDYDGTPVAGTPLAKGFNVQAFDERNGVGHGSVSLPLSEAGAVELLPGRYVNVLVEGTVVFTFKIVGNPKYESIMRGEEFQQVVTVSGSGWGIVFNESQTYPEVPFDVPLDTSWRLFTFASPSFPNAGSWASAVEIYEYLDGVTVTPLRGRFQQAPDLQLYPSPIGFPWPLSPNNGPPNLPVGSEAGYEPTYWIWSEAGHSTEEFELGWCFFRRTFTIVDRSIFVFDATADNFFTYFLEGVPTQGEEDDHFIWMGWKDFNVDLPDGTYTVACVVENVSIGVPGEGTTANPGGFITAMYTVDSNNTPVDMVFVSDASWDCLFVPVTGAWPGWSPWQIVDKLIDEGVARGGLTIFNSLTGSATVDTAGDAWRPLDPDFDSPYVPSFAVKVGSTLLDALTQLHDEGWIDWHVRPGTFILDMWRARQPSPSSSATFSHTVNIRALERNTTEPYANALLVQWSGGYVEVDDAAAITAYGTRVEALYASDATSEADAQRIGVTELMKRAYGAYPSVIMVAEPTSAADCPYEAFDTTDFITIPAREGGTEIVRVLSIDIQQDPDGYAIWTLELNAKLDVPERRQYDLIQQLGGRNQIVRGVVN